MSYIHQTLLERRLPNLEEVIGIFKSNMQTGNARDVRPLMSLAERCIEHDTRLQGHFTVRTAAVTGFGWRIVAKDSQYAEQAAGAQERLSEIISTYLDNIVKAAYYGAFVMEIEWKVNDETGLFEWRINKEFEPTEIELDKKKVHILTPTSLGFTRTPIVNTVNASNYYITDIYNLPPILHGIVIREVLLNNNQKDWAEFAKKLNGLAMAFWDESASDAEKTMAKNVIRSLSKVNYAASSRRISYDFKEFVSGQGAQTYPTIKSELEKDIAIAVLGQANTAELPKGSGLAAMQVLNLVRGDILWMDIQRAVKVINSQIIKTDYRFNYNNTQPPYYFEFDLAEEIDREKEIRIVDTGLKAGLTFVTSEVYKRIGYTMPENTPEILKSTTSAGLF